MKPKPPNDGGEPRLLRVTQRLFAFSDAIAWLLVAVALASCLLLPLAEWADARMSRRSISALRVLTELLLGLLTAGGAYGVTRRQSWAIVVTLAPALAWTISGHAKAGLGYAVGCAVVFGLPFLLAFLTACSSARRDTPR